MTSLHSRQSEFAAALFNPVAEIPRGLVGPDGRPSARRFGVYRNNVIVGLVDALRDAYPAVCQLVGEEFFKAMARVYVSSHPPKSPVLLCYGSEFPEFLESFEPVAHLVYLADVARLERAWVESYHAQEAEPLEICDLETMLLEAGLRLSFRFHSSLRLLSSQYPALTIWRRNAGDLEAAEMNLHDCEGESVLIVRPHAHVEVRGIPQAYARWIAELIKGETLLSATTTVLEFAVDFDPTAALALLVEANAICSVEVEAVKKPAGDGDVR